MNFLKNISLFIWLCQVLAAAYRIFIAACGIFVAACEIQFPDQDRTQAPCIDIMES